MVGWIPGAEQDSASLTVSYVIKILEDPPHQTRQANRVRDHELDQLPHPSAALRRPTQLVAHRPQPTRTPKSPKR
jgi:hypothetical protein